LKPLPACCCCEAEERGDVGGVVERAVVEAVAVHGLAIAVAARDGPRRDDLFERTGSVPGNRARMLSDWSWRWDWWNIASMRLGVSKDGSGCDVEPALRMAAALVLTLR